MILIKYKTNTFSIFLYSLSLIISVLSINNNLLQYQNVENVAIFDRCSQNLPGFAYNISNSGQINCIELKCNKSTQIEFDGGCLNCPTFGCSCPPGSLLKTRITSESKTLLECQHYKRISENSLLKHLPCSISHFIASNGSCICPKNDEYSEENGICIQSKNSISDENRVIYSTIYLDSDRKFLSNLIYSSLRGAISECFHTHYSNQTACNLLMNLCTIKLVTISTLQQKRNDQKNFCFFLTKLNKSFIFQYSSISQIESAYVPADFKSLEELKIISFSYFLNGSFFQSKNLTLESLFNCWNSKLRHQRILFGQSLTKKCSWNIEEILKFSYEPLFYEFYLKINNSFLLSIPVKIINSYNYQNSWILKRFFFADSSLGIEEETLKFWYLIFAKRITLEFLFDSKNNQIILPKIHAEYRILNNEELNKKSIFSHFNVDFRSQDSDGRLVLRLALLFCFFIAIIWSIFKTWIWRQISGCVSCDCLMTTMIFIVKLCQSCANLFLFTIFLFISNQLFVFKYQKSVYSLLPSRETETEIFVYVCIIFFFKTIQILAKIHEITSAEIFFIDWEKPRKKLHSTMNGNLDSNHHAYQTSDTTSAMYKRLKRTSIQLENLTSVLEHLHTPVTIWRSYFVANEWYELTKKRRINLFAHICLVVLFLEGSLFSQQMVRSMPMTNDPLELENLNEISISMSARIMFAGCVYSILGFLQYFYQRFFREACRTSKLNEFIDLCTVSNISIFCLLHRRFGYYLHGLSPNGRSEVNMMEMYELLEMEESDLCSKRGLMVNTEQQTFEMFLPRDIHTQLLNLRRPVDDCQKTFLRQYFTCTVNSGEQLRALSKEKLFQIYLSINRFLTSFIDHTYEKVDYRVVDKNRWETVFGFETKSDSAKFFNDNGSSMENILFFGLEVTFITFEMLSFLIVDLLVGGNFMLAGIVSAALSFLIKHLYVCGTRRNLVQKTLVDDRFLI